MGQWTLGVNGSDATILTLDDGNAPVLTKEAVFCPPDVNGAAAELGKSVLGQN
jgi:hypothetical protein